MANLTGSWLAFRLGVDPVRIERMRRDGELYAVRNDSGEWEYPSWQFGAAGELKPAVAEFLASARREKIAPAELSGGDLLPPGRRQELGHGRFQLAHSVELPAWVFPLARVVPHRIELALPAHPFNAHGVDSESKREPRAGQVRHRFSLF